MNTIKIAFYGTLMNENQKSFLYHSSFRGRMYDVGAFPAVVRGDGIVHCQVHEIDEEELSTFDNYEGYYIEDKENSLYLREKVVLHSGEEVEVYIYNKSVIGFKEIKLGKWRNGDEK